MRDANITLADALFSAEVALSDRYPSLNPFIIRNQPIREFCLILNGTKKTAKRSKRQAKYKDWKPAGDKWF